MAAKISSALDKHGFVYLYDSKGGVIRSLKSSTKPGEGLQGYTSDSVSIRRDGFLYVYSADGQVLFSRLAK